MPCTMFENYGRLFRRKAVSAILSHSYVPCASVPSKARGLETAAKGFLESAASGMKAR